jgi:hypothetical protein
MAAPGTSPRGTPSADGGDVRTGQSDVDTFRSPTALIVWVVWLLFAVANWIDLAVQGRDHLSAVAAAILLLVTGLFYACAQRPRIIAGPAGVTIRNPLRDHRVSWAAICGVELADLLRVRCDWGPPGAQASNDGGSTHRVISCWAVHYSRRRSLAAEAKARRAASPRRQALSLSFASYGSCGLSAASEGVTPEAEAERIARLLRERATAARAETVWTNGTAAPTTAGWAGPPQSTWSRVALAAIGIPALILLIVCLL